MATMECVCNVLPGLELLPRHKKARYEVVGKKRI